MRIRTTPAFLRQANRTLKKNPQLREPLREALIKLTADPYQASLKTHKLKGDLKDFWSCSVTFEIRLRFKLTEDALELIDLGTHDEVY